MRFWGVFWKRCQTRLLGWGFSRWSCDYIQTNPPWDQRQLETNKVGMFVGQGIDALRIGLFHLPIQPSNKYLVIPIPSEWKPLPFKCFGAFLPGHKATDTETQSWKVVCYLSPRYWSRPSEYGSTGLLNIRIFYERFLVIWMHGIRKPWIYVWYNQLSGVSMYFIGYWSSKLINQKDTFKASIKSLVTSDKQTFCCFSS